jgi:hypothetical protein
VVLTPEEADARRSDLRRGWYWGTQQFAERMLQLAQAPLRRVRSRSYRAAPLNQRHNEQRAEELLEEGLRVAGLSHQELEMLPGADPRKVAIARVIWEQTTVGQGWLAERLAMGSAANVSQQIRRNQQAPSAKMKQWVKHSQSRYVPLRYFKWVTGQPDRG